MDPKHQLIERMLSSGFKKLTGPPEDWLKALITMEWGLRDKERLRQEWEKIKAGDIFVFHSMKTEHLEFHDTPTGLIGVGVISRTYIGEDVDVGFEPANLRPLRLEFKEMWWFGEIERIDLSETFHEKMKKGKRHIEREVDFLTLNCITFAEMRSKGFTISTQGAIQRIRKDKWEPLVELISLRLDSSRCRRRGEDILSGR